MIYLLDANALITTDMTYYPPANFPVFWEWLEHQAQAGTVKVPSEIFVEITNGHGLLVEWLSDRKGCFKLQEQADVGALREVTDTGYGLNLTDEEHQTIGKDPFLVAYGLADLGNRTVVTFETSAQSKTRARRKLPDVCAQFNVPCCSIFDMIKALKFNTNWRP